MNRGTVERTAGSAEPRPAAFPPDRGLQELQQALDSAVEGMTEAQWMWHPAEKWCAAEVLEHLYLTYTGTIKGFERVLQAEKPMATRASLKNRLQTGLVLGFNYLPTGRKSPPNAAPKGLPAEKVRGEFAVKIAAMDQIISQCEERFGRRTKLLDHPILGPLTGPQWKKFHVVHGRHHEKQLRQLREAQFASKVR
jgi:hypothetical protein